MKAIITKKLGNPPETVIAERPKPAFKDGFTLVRMHSATINQLSNTIRKGEIGNTKAPIVLGNEGSGVVEESGKFSVGARVAIYGHNELGITEDGLFQEYVLVADKRILELPDNLDWDEGAALTVSYLTAYRALTHIAKVQAGQTVLVSGASGSVGHALMQVTKALGGQPIAVVSSPEKAARVRKAGALSVIDLSSQNLVEAVFDLSGGEGVDAALDPVGGAIFGQSVRALRRRGKFVSIGFTGGKEAPVDVVDLIVFEKFIVGYSLHSETDDDIAGALVELGELAAQGHLKPVIDTVVPLEDFERGYDRLTSRQAVGSIILRL
ncbi:MAG TPA: zinc-binding alcohol dehydrogenase family protein [Bryobacteraceae bacterium]